MNESTQQLEAPRIEIDPMAAFVGALDDIAANTVQADSSAGEEFAERVMGLFDTASTFYDEDMAKSMELVTMLAGRLGEMACEGHNHFMDTLNSINEKYELVENDKSHDSHDEHDGHGHGDEDKATHDTNSCERCKVGRYCANRK